MTTWGKYAIVAVRYNSDGSHIAKVKRKDVGESALSNSTRISRQSVVTDLKKGIRYTTAIKNSNGDWSLGDEVEIYEINGQEFIRTEPNNTPEDNLEGLPTF
ncbi:MAG: DUF3892 domain-containing protein [Euryarchaeota archaeon]|nr:DUF3892 domain-containing protein [Euryarchaeota archaeon]